MKGIKMVVEGLALVFLLLMGLVGARAQAATNSANVNIVSTVNARAKLTLSSATISFGDEDPDVVKNIPAKENAITVTSKIRSNSACDLMVLAKDDLFAGKSSIAINNVTWTATGKTYQDGTMNKDKPQTVGSWSAGSSGTYAGTLSFFLANSWDYAPGSYASTAVFTLTAP